MKINWTVRLRNPVFWIGIIPTTVTFVYSILSAFNVVPSITSSDISDMLLTIVTALSTLGVLTDPTTKGVSDSTQALSYTSPKGDDADA